MKKHFFFLMLLVCLIGTFLPELSFAQDKPPKVQQLPDLPTTNIVGGTNTNISTVPWQVLLEVNGQDACGGTIIAPNWILTACHCLEDITTGVFFQPNQIDVYAGISLRSAKNTGQRRDVLQIIRNAGWNRNTFANDIALLRLSTPLTFNANVQSVRYATAADANAGVTNAGVNTLISGWGLLAAGGVQPNQLQSVNVPIIANATAQTQWAPGRNITANMLPTQRAGGGAGQGACNGDSGGPVIVLNGGIPIVAGIVSFGVPCALAGVSDIHTRVSNYCDWISDNITAIENGGNVTCASTTTFNLRHHPFGANVTWTATPASAFVTNSGTGTAASLRARAGVNGTATLTFTINGGCGITTVTRTVSYGTTPLTVTPDAVNMRRGQLATIVANLPVSRWVVSNGLTIVSQNNTQIRVSASANGVYSVTAERSDNCTTYSRRITVNVTDSSPSPCSSPPCPLQPSVIVYPNPADEVLVVELEAAAFANSSPASAIPSADVLTLAATSATTQTYPRLSVKLLDSRQQVVRQAESTTGKIQLDIRQLHPGIYILHVYDQKTLAQEQIIVQ